MKRKASTQKTKKTTTGVSKKRRTGDYQSGREMPGAPKQELKAFDVARNNLSLESVAGPPNFVLLNAVVNGAELYQRVGRKVYNKSLHIRGWFDPSGGSASQDYARIIVFYDAQPNAAAPTIATLLQDSNAAAGTSAQSEINLVNRSRFKILADRQFLLPTITAGVQGAMADSDGALRVDMFLKLKGLESVYNATNGGTIADISSGSLFLVSFVDLNAAEWNFPFTSRLRYYD